MAAGDDRVTSSWRPKAVGQPAAAAPARRLARRGGRGRPAARTSALAGAGQLAPAAHAGNALDVQDVQLQAQYLAS